MLSILIPTYNYNINPLVEELYHQANACDIKFEIIVADDASTVTAYNPEELSKFENFKLIKLQNNIGRSAVRNLLANRAQYNNILFVDAGTFPNSKNFLNKYLTFLGNDVTIGGMTYNIYRPQTLYVLRWLYTKKRESNTRANIYTSANFLTKKSIIFSNPFDEKIKTYGYEDLLFFKLLELNGISPKFINNPVRHDCNEDPKTFIKKTEEALKNLKKLSLQHTELFNDNRIIKFHKRLKILHLDTIFCRFFSLTKVMLLKNLHSSYPSLFIFDLYKLGYFCKIKQND